MKNIYIIFSLLFFSFSLMKGQNLENIDIPIGVCIPDSYDGLTNAQLVKLGTKVEKIVTANGMAAWGSGDFVLFPTFDIYDKSVVEGMKNIYVVKAEMTIFIKQVGTNKVFGSISKTLSGGGSNYKSSITNAISKVNARDPKFKTFIEDGKKKIVKYYNDNCDKILNKARDFAKVKEYEKALAHLAVIPDVTSCYSKVRTELLEIYVKYEAELCEKLYLKAKAAAAANYYENALYYLSLIDPKSPCESKVNSLMTKISSEVDEEAKREYELQKQMYNDEAKLQQMKMKAMVEIAKGYAASQPVNYTVISK